MEVCGGMRQGDGDCLQPLTIKIQVTGKRKVCGDTVEVDCRIVHGEWEVFVEYEIGCAGDDKVERDAQAVISYVRQPLSAMSVVGPRMICLRVIAKIADSRYTKEEEGENEEPSRQPPDAADSPLIPGEQFP